MKVFSLLILFLYLFYGSQAQNPVISDPIKRALDGVKPDQIKADITYLANDKLKGRLPGSEGYKMAMDYVIKRMEAMGVKPAGEHGTWVQTVRLKRSFILNPKITFQSFSGEMIQPSTKPNDFIIYPNPMESHSVLPLSDLVFAGFGISEPELGFDDYSGLDVKGKVVLILRGAPESFSSSVKAHSMNYGHLVKVAGEHGAIGIIIGNPDSTDKTVPDLSHGVYNALVEKGNMVVSRTFSSSVHFFGYLNFEAFQNLFKNKSISMIYQELKKEHFQSFPLGMKVGADFNSRTEDILGYNLVGKIEGSDPVLNQEYIVHSAHLDHLGIRNPPILGDSIYNGAHDNASGVASLLAIAGIYHQIPIKPKRSVLLVIVTGEELGLLGSSYFAHKPTVPLKSLVADVNTDMPTIIAPLLSVTALGAEHSSLANEVDWAAKILDLGVEPDPEPKEARFTRSDQYSFVSMGIPALHIKYGNRTPDGKNNLNEKVALWRAQYYHKPQDDINGIFDFEAGKKYAQLNFLIGYKIAQSPNKPVWNKGDIFEKY